MDTKVFGTLANLSAPKIPTDLKYGEITKALKDLQVCNTVTKPPYHWSLLLFQQRKKEAGKALNFMFSNLKSLAKNCNFGSTFEYRNRLRDQLFMVVDNQSYFRFLVAEYLGMENMTTAKLLTNQREFLLRRKHTLVSMGQVWISMWGKLVICLIIQVHSNQCANTVDVII